MPGRDRHGRREPLQILDAANRRIRQLLGAHHGYRKWNLLYTFRNAPRRNDNIFDASALGPIVGRSILRRWLLPVRLRSEEHTSELQSLMRISYAVFCLKKKKNHTT